MIEVITTAGLEAGPVAPTNVRRERIKTIRAVLRRTDATEDQDVDALEALLELSKE